jgi:hypothetical protein
VFQAASAAPLTCAARRLPNQLLILQHVLLRPFGQLRSVQETQRVCVDVQNMSADTDTLGMDGIAIDTFSISFQQSLAICFSTPSCKPWMCTVCRDAEKPSSRPHLFEPARELDDLEDPAAALRK